MLGNLFDVVVHYEDENGNDDDMPTVTVLSKDDIEAREVAIALAYKVDKEEYRNDIKKILYCEVRHAGTLDAKAGKRNSKKATK